MEGYKVDAIRYLLKNNTNLEASISECMDAILHKMNLVVKKKKFKFNEGEKEINIDNILSVSYTHLNITLRIIKGCNFITFIIK